MSDKLSPSSRRFVDRATELGLHAEVQEHPDSVEVLVRHPFRRNTWVQWMQYKRRGRYSHYANELDGDSPVLESILLKEAQLRVAQWGYAARTLSRKDG